MANLSESQIRQLQEAFNNQPADVIRGQFMESSEKYLALKLEFEKRFKDNPLSYLFASIVLFRLRYT